MEKEVNTSILVASLIVIIGVLIYFNAFSHIRLILTDQLQGKGVALDNIVIIKIDDSSIQQIGRWPWNRDVFADLIKKVKDAKAIGVDVSFLEPSNSDKELEKILENMNNVILAAEINEGVIYKPIFKSKIGYVNIETDSDGVSRSIKINEKENPPFAFAVYETAWNLTGKAENDKHFIYFNTPPNTFKSYSAIEVLTGNIELNGKIVLIGATAPDLHDAYFVPTSKGKAMSGVEIHANIIQNLILKQQIKKQGKFSIFFLSLLAIIIGIFYARLRIAYTIFAVFCTIFLYSIAGIIIFQQNNYMADLFFFPISLIISTGTIIGVNYAEERKQTRFLTNAFSKYVSKDVVKELIEKKDKLKLGGEKKTITVFFSDIRGFTSISEKLSPEELVKIINAYLTKMTSIIMQEKGTVDKFIGDAIMAFWNAPISQANHAEIACKSALAQLNALKSLKKEFENNGLPEINIGCGIHTGEAIIGNMGSEERFNYTAMGDTVNLASRLESLTKQYGVSAIISESTYSEVKEKFLCRKLDLVKVKGKKIPIAIYELCENDDKKIIRLYEIALSLYLKRDFEKAGKAFAKVLKNSSKDVATINLIARCIEYKKHPPKKDWDGSYEMKTK